MNKNITALCFFFSILFIATVVDAHSGRTDSSGGHNCSEKSIAKGLCTGYHYHNGGGGSSSGGGTAPAPVTRRDKNCSDFATYDEVVEYWNAKGYSATYDPENLDGFGNGVVDDGIPCEPPTGYDKTKVNNSPEQAQYKQDQQDNETGEASGYEQGYLDGIQSLPKNSTATSGSDAYKQGYEAGYNKGYEDGKKALEADKTKAYEEGYSLGQKQDEIKIPKVYIFNQILKESYESGFSKALNERVEAKKNDLINLGYKDGKNDVYSLPDDLEDMYIKAYKEGYEKAQAELQEDYINQGYEASFKMIDYEKPSISNDKFIGWYRKGFESNKEVIEIQKMAYALGREGNAKDIPAEFEKGEVIFYHYYELGFKEYKEEVESNQKAAAGGVGVVALAWLGRRFYVARKMIR